MQLKNIWLQNFRNHSNLTIDIDPRLTIIIGPNGSGKTNILEAVYLLATGRSFKAGKISEMINWNHQIARIKGHLENQTELEAILTTGQVQGQKTRPKQLNVNGVSRQIKKYTGNIRAVIFGPADMRLIEGSPSRRRDYLNEVLDQINPEYHRSRISYEKGIRRRNKVLINIREHQANRNQLFFWNKLIIKEGNYLTQTRQKYIDYLNQNRNQLLLAEFQPQIIYDHSKISPQRIEQYAHQEISAGVTLVGPHRDDISIKLQTNNKYKNNETTKQRKIETIDLSTYGSRGQQRMAVLWLKLSALEYITQQAQDKPLLLLDDIFSELDHHHRDIINQTLNQYQTILTSADPHLISNLNGKSITLD